MRRLFYLASALVVLTLLELCRTSRAREITEGSELLNPTLDRRAEGRFLRSAVPEPELRHGDSASVRLDGVEPGPQSWSHAGVAISPVPADRELRFDCQVRGHADGQKASVNVFGYYFGKKDHHKWVTTEKADGHGKRGVHPDSLCRCNSVDSVVDP